MRKSPNDLRQRTDMMILFLPWDWPSILLLISWNVLQTRAQLHDEVDDVAVVILLTYRIFLHTCGTYVVNVPFISLRFPRVILLTLKFSLLCG